MTSSPDARIPPNHEQLKLFIQELIQHWNSFLKSIPEKHIGALGDKHLPFIESYTGKWHQKISKKRLGLHYFSHFFKWKSTAVENTKQLKTETVLDTFLKDANYKITLNAQHKIPHDYPMYFWSEKRPPHDVIQFYKDLQQTIYVMHELLAQWLAQHSAWQTQFDEGMLREINRSSDKNYHTALNTVKGIFYDNVLSTSHTFQLLFGDVSDQPLEEILARINSILFEKANTVVDERYASLTKVALTGKLSFGVLATFGNEGFVLNHQFEVENAFEKLSQLVAHNIEKKWNGCPAIAVIPRSMHSTLALMVELHPNRYSMDDQGAIHLQEVKHPGLFQKMYNLIQKRRLT